MHTDTSVPGIGSCNQSKNQHTSPTLPTYSQQAFNKEASHGLKRSGYPAFDSAKNCLGTIGWGTNMQAAIDVNKQEPRIQKPTIKWLDLAKQSNFINYLQTKHNEINHQR